MPGCGIPRIGYLSTLATLNVTQRNHDAGASPLTGHGPAAPGITAKFAPGPTHQVTVQPCDRSNMDTNISPRLFRTELGDKIIRSISKNPRPLRNDVGGIPPIEPLIGMCLRGGGCHCAGVVEAGAQGIGSKVAKSLFPGKASARNGFIGLRYHLSRQSWQVPAQRSLHCV